MEKRIFKTLIKDNHKFGNNPYVRGRISGMAYVLFGCDKQCAHIRYENLDGVLFRYNGLPEEYEKFKEVVESCYPGLCIFDYNLEESE